MTSAAEVVETEGTQRRGLLIHEIEEAVYTDLARKLAAYAAALTDRRDP